MKERQSLFDRSYQLEQEIFTLQEDLKELKGEYTYHKEYCVDGFDKDEVAKIMKAARAKVKQDNLKEKAEELLEITEIIEKYSGNV